MTRSLGLLILAAILVAVSAEAIVVRVDVAPERTVTCLEGCSGGSAPTPPRLTPSPGELCTFDVRCPSCSATKPWKRPFGCQPEPWTAAAPTPKPTATPAKLSGGPLEAVWFGGEPILQAISLPIVYAIDPASAVNHCRKNGKTLDVEIWNGLIGENTEAAAQVYFDSRIKPYLAERLTNQPQCPKPGLVYRENMVASWAATQWNLNGFCGTVDSKSGKCVKTRPVEKWPPVLGPGDRKIIELWVKAGGGPVYDVPYVFSDIAAIQNNPRQNGGTFLDRAVVVEPWLFCETIDEATGKCLKRLTWGLLEGTQVDRPTHAAWRVGKTALDRFYTRRDWELDQLQAHIGTPFLIKRGSVVQISNGAYQSEGSPWRNRFVVQICGLMQAHGMDCRVQVELYKAGTQQSVAPCTLISALRKKGAKVSAFDGSKAIPTWPQLVSPACNP